jgi:hypothetical protein
LKTLFVYGVEDLNEMRMWILDSEQITPFSYKCKSWYPFSKSINEILMCIQRFKPDQIIFDEVSECEDMIWDAVTSRCDNELEITIGKDGKIIFRQKS